ncbi:MAG: hypothetical protein JW947_07805, partial [Sedimentisphaerales bacterium]|nr:hypothetical protein [Sedimentisphaerales bacterium]
TALAESSPAEAVALLVKAGKLQQQQKSNELNIEADRIAEQAAQLAYNIFAADSLDCAFAIEAFESYCTIAGEKINEELEYLYTIILNNCGENTKNREVLEKITGRPEGKLSSRAKLDLILQAMQTAGDSASEQQRELLKKLDDFILSCGGRDENNSKLRAEAINIYCRTILESEDTASAEKVLETLTKAENTTGVNIDLLKAQALQRLGRLSESARCMLSAIEGDSGSLAPAVSELLAEVIEKIDDFKDTNSPMTMENYKKLAQFCYSTLNDRQSGLLLAEISILAADKNRKKLSEADNLLSKLAADGNGIDLLRCKARLACEKTEFDKASSLWAKIAEMQKNKSPQTDRQNTKWWRAKYYELYCLSKCPQAKNGEILHTIEVLENSHADIPPLWSENLKMLKQQLAKSGK